VKYEEQNSGLILWMAIILGGFFGGVTGFFVIRLVLR
jgi:hypothetical protein